MKSKFLDSQIPLYLQLAELMRQRIVRGEWPQGSRLPTLEQLVEEFGVARVTVRHALGMLDRQGMVSRQQGRGTFVTHQPARDQWVNVVTTLDELAKVYHDTRPTIVNIDESSKLPTIRPSEGQARERYVFMRRIHSRDGLPYCVINIYIDDELFRRNPENFRTQTVIPLLASMQVVADAHQTLTIGSADLEVAQCLDLPINAPVAEVRRIFRNTTGEVIYLAEVTYRGDAIRFEMNLKP